MGWSRLSEFCAVLGRPVTWDGPWPHCEEGRSSGDDSGDTKSGSLGVGAFFTSSWGALLASSLGASGTDVDFGGCGSFLLVLATRSAAAFTEAANFFIFASSSSSSCEGAAVGGGGAGRIFRPGRPPIDDFGGNGDARVLAEDSLLGGRGGPVTVCEANEVEPVEP